MQADTSFTIQAGYATMVMWQLWYNFVAWPLGFLLLTWINLDPRMEKEFYVQHAGIKVQ